MDDINTGNIEPSIAVQQYRISDVTDPDTNPAGGPVLGGTPLPYPSNNLTPTAPDDNDVISIAKGTFSVPTAGTYTIQVRSDDGMAFRVNGTPFTAVYGAGGKDANGAMVFPGDTGDANSRGVITLTAGEHSFEFLMWERGGGAHWEITKTAGAPDVTPSPSTRWTPLVDLDNAAVGLLPKDLPGVEGGAGTVGVTDYYGGEGGPLGTLDSLQDALTTLEQVIEGDLEARIESGQYAITDFYDPQSGNGPVLGGTPMRSHRIPRRMTTTSSASPGVLSMSPKPAPIRFRCDSDDGMGFRMIGTPFKEVYGAGQLDVDGAIIHPAVTGDANTRGVIELTKGQHQFEFLMWERGGGAYWEITSSSDSHPDQTTALAGTGRWPGAERSQPHRSRCGANGG